MCQPVNGTRNCYARCESFAPLLRFGFFDVVYQRGPAIGKVGL
jgi:hypothetical protein